MPPAAALHAPAHWRTLEFISDVHLTADDTATAQAWLHYLAGSRADAVFILGDLFEVWIGDDQLEAPSAFLSDCIDGLQALSRRCALYFMHGNRDFLAGPRLMRACGAQLLDDPSTLVLGTDRILLSHGDALCLDDAAYLAFRHQVRSAAWQEAFLARPLAEREALARQLRAQSQQQQSERHARGQGHADVDEGQALTWLTQHQARLLVHGHTHRPGRHTLATDQAREVLSDWDLRARPPRAQVLRLHRHAAGFALERSDLA